MVTKLKAWFWAFVAGVGAVLAFVLFRKRPVALPTELDLDREAQEWKAEAGDDLQERYDDVQKDVRESDRSVADDMRDFYGWGDSGRNSKTDDS